MTTREKGDEKSTQMFSAKEKSQNVKGKIFEKIFSFELEPRLFDEEQLFYKFPLLIHPRAMRVFYCFAVVSGFIAKISYVL